MFMEMLLEVMDEIKQDVNLMSGTIGLVAYILQALALQTIATRRGINKPWLAWVPLVNVWVLGSISDQYHYVTKREVRNKRKLLLGLSIASFAVAITFVAVAVGITVNVMLSSGDFLTGILPGSDLSDMNPIIQATADNIGWFFLLIALTIPLIGIAITLTIHTWMAIYDLFRSCDPSNATVYLVVSIVGGFVVSGVQTIFMMICREKDLGMPPRREEPVQPVVEYQPEEPWVQE